MGHTKVQRLRPRLQLLTKNLQNGGRLFWLKMIIGQDPILECGISQEGGCLETWKTSSEKWKI